MPSDRSLAYWQRVKWGEGLVLLFASPFLLFPDRFFALTFISLILLAALWLAPVLLIRDALIPPTPFNAALFLFCLTICIAILVSADPHLTLPKATGLILGLAVWRFIILAVKQDFQVRWAVAGYLAAGLAFITIGLLNANWVDKAASRVPVLGSLLSQSFINTPLTLLSTGIHPNQLAGTITLVLPLLVALLIASFSGHPGRRVVRWALLLATFFCGAILLLTQSRSGWVGTAGGLLVMITVWGLTMPPSKKRRVVRISTGVLVAALLLLLVILGPQQIQQTWLNPPQETAVGSLSTLNLRQDLWPWAAQAISDFPFTGIGLGAFREAARRLYPIPVAAEFDFAHAHNVFLQVALDLGIAGLIAYAAILLVSIAIAWQLAKRTHEFHAYAIGLLASLAAFHIFGLADALALGSKPAVLLWALFGLLAAMIRLD